MKLEHEEITKTILGAAFEVHHILGYGFPEKSTKRHCRWSWNTGDYRQKR
jgi:hypothetical protein